MVTTWDNSSVKMTVSQLLIYTRKGHIKMAEWKKKKKMAEWTFVFLFFAFFPPYFNMYCVWPTGWPGISVSTSLLLFRIEKSQLKWHGHLYRCFLHTSTQRCSRHVQLGGGPGYGSGHVWISQLAWECLGPSGGVWVEESLGAYPVILNYTNLFAVQKEPRKESQEKKKKNKQQGLLG